MKAKEILHLLGITRQTLYNYLKQGKVKLKQKYKDLISKLKENNIPITFLKQNLHKFVRNQSEYNEDKRIKIIQKIDLL